MEGWNSSLIFHHLSDHNFRRAGGRKHPVFGASASWIWPSRWKGRLVLFPRSVPCSLTGFRMTDRKIFPSGSWWKRQTRFSFRKRRKKKFPPGFWRIVQWFGSNIEDLVDVPIKSKGWVQSSSFFSPTRSMLNGSFVSMLIDRLQTPILLEDSPMI